MIRLALQILTVAVASSYLTMGLFARDTAGDFWWPYAILMFVLTVSGLVADRYCEVDSDHCEADSDH
jgi:hypothetical protein